MRSPARSILPPLRQESTASSLIFEHLRKRWRDFEHLSIIYLSFERKAIVFEIFLRYIRLNSIAAQYISSPADYERSLIEEVFDVANSNRALAEHWKDMGFLILNRQGANRSLPVSSRLPARYTSPRFCRRRCVLMVWLANRGAGPYKAGSSAAQAIPRRKKWWSSTSAGSRLPDSVSLFSS